MQLYRYAETKKRCKPSSAVCLSHFRFDADFQAPVDVPYSRHAPIPFDTFWSQFKAVDSSRSDYCM
jgi:hypothetical protein